ncbi:hypothetical protein FP026_04740 [Rhizobium tropici]|uniref:Uncharacterized protein n=1 Tax=Rhizobium tropici TaxID=398 RepID=A0A5B0WC87_RHITR|nr:hypothetical protein [Rhizobium tropici]KAA1184684.1 hypothetical protein FP026_04740 [Rhizobium tropici]
MQNTKLRSRILAATLTALVALGATSSAHAYSIYRSVTADAATGIVVWTAVNFGVSGNPPTLSFYYYPNDAAALLAMPGAQCFVKVDLGNLVNPPPGTQIPIGNGIQFNANAADNPRPFPWNVVFDNVQPGHWSIAKTEIQNPTSSNNAASRVAAVAFQALATTAGSGTTVVNGQLTNCAAQ